MLDACVKCTSACYYALMLRFSSMIDLLLINSHSTDYVHPSGFNFPRGTCPENLLCAPRFCRSRGQNNIFYCKNICFWHLFLPWDLFGPLAWNLSVRPCPCPGAHMTREVQCLGWVVCLWYEPPTLLHNQTFSTQIRNYSEDSHCEHLKDVKNQK